MTGNVVKRFGTQGLELGEGLKDAKEKGVNKESEGYMTKSRGKH